MKAVYECPASKKAQLTAILEADPYGEKEPEPYFHVSFGRNGYKLKDGAVVDEDREKCYLYLSMPDSFKAFADMKLKDVAARAPAEVEARVVKKIEDEEASAEMGMGAIFG